MNKIFENLTKFELNAANDWYQKLAILEQTNIEKVIKHFNDWCKGELEKKDDCKEFYTVFAIGSTITDEPDPNDVDLLLITNLYFNMAHKPEISTLISRFQKEFELNFDEELDKAYATAPHSRIRITMTPKIESSKNIDFVVQYDIISEERWIKNDRFDNVPLLRHGRHNERDAITWYNGQYVALPMSRYMKNSY